MRIEQIRRGSGRMLKMAFAVGTIWFGVRTNIRRLFVRSLYCCVISLSLAHSAWAQTSPAFGLPPRPLENINGVDVYEHHFSLSSLDMELGQKDSENYLPFVRIYNTTLVSPIVGAGWRFNFSSGVLVEGYGSYVVDVVYEGQVNAFAWQSGGNFVALSGQNRTWLSSGTPYSGNYGFTVHFPDGGLAYYYDQGSQCSGASVPASIQCSASLQKIVRPNGANITFSNLTSVMSSYGYGYDFFYNSFALSSVTAKSTTCAGSCNTTAIGSLSFAYVDSSAPGFTSTKVLASVSANGLPKASYTYAASFPVISSVKAADGSVLYTNNWDPNVQDQVYSQTFPDNTTAFFATNLKDRAGNAYAVTVDNNPYNPGILSWTDQLGRTTSYSNDSDGFLIRQVNPNGAAIEWTYDARHNVTRECRIPAERAGNPCNPSLDLVKSMAYVEGPTVGLANCANARVCNRPAYAIDENGNRINYTWSTVHGQLLTETSGLNSDGSCSANGGCPTTTYGYSAFTGVDGATFYLKTSETKAISATQSTTTTFGYDSSNHFALTEVVVDADGQSLRTCRKVDAVGNVISTTQPRAGLATCQ